MKMEKEFRETPQERINRAIRRKNMRRIFLIFVSVMILVILVYGGTRYTRRQNANLPGVAFPDQGREHVAPGHQHEYNSNPPTSGWHWWQPAEWGVYKTELLDEQVVHNLEHGGIWISYKPGIPDEMRQKLEAFYEKWGRKIIVTPRAKNDSDIALAAWTRLDTLSVAEYSDDRIEKFIKAFRNKGPEFVP